MEKNKIPKKEGELKNNFWSISLILIFIMAYGSIITIHNYVNDDENIRFYLVAGLFLDDAFYYYKTALNFSNSGIASFDGINQTNGFHPLWFFICIPFVAILSSAQLLTSMIWIQILLYFSSVFFLVKAVAIKKYQILFIFTCLSLMASHHYTRINFNGLETSLYVFNISLALYAFRRYIQTKHKPTFLLVTLLLVFFSRIDGLLLSLTICAIIFLKINRSDGLKIGLTLLVSSACYFIINLFTIGEFFPISGITKEIGALYIHNSELQNGKASISLWLSYFLWPINNPYILFILGINALAIPFYVYKKEYVGLSFSIFIILKFIFYIVKYKAGAGYYLWYYIPDFISATYFFVFALNLLIKKYDNRTLILLIFIFSIYQIRNEYLILRASMSYQFERVHSTKNPFIGSDLDMYYLSSKILNENNFPAETIIGMHNSGVFGFFSNYHVVNMDGLINGNIRLSYTRKYPFSWLEYVDQAQPIDAYFDLIYPESVKTYSEALVSRGFSVNELTESDFINYGFFSKPKNEFNLMLYLRPGLELKKY